MACLAERKGAAARYAGAPYGQPGTCDANQLRWSKCSKPTQTPVAVWESRNGGSSCWILLAGRGCIPNESIHTRSEVQHASLKWAHTSLRTKQQHQHWALQSQKGWPAVTVFVAPPTATLQQIECGQDRSVKSRCPPMHQKHYVLSDLVSIVYLLQDGCRRKVTGNADVVSSASIAISTVTQAEPQGDGGIGRKVSQPKLCPPIVGGALGSPRFLP